MDSITKWNIKIKTKNDILLIFKSTVFIFTAYVICPQETKKKNDKQIKKYPEI